MKYCQLYDNYIIFLHVNFLPDFNSGPVQSSVEPDISVHGPGQALDGDKTTYTKTHYESKPWWMVKLRSITTVKYVTILGSKLQHIIYTEL